MREYNKEEQNKLKKASKLYKEYSALFFISKISNEK